MFLIIAENFTREIHHKQLVRLTLMWIIMIARHVKEHRRLRGKKWRVTEVATLEIARFS